MLYDQCKKGRKLTRPVCVTRFSMSTSSLFITGTGDASPKRTDAISKKKKRAMRAMVVEGNYREYRIFWRVRGETLENRIFE